MLLHALLGTKGQPKQKKEEIFRVRMHRLIDVLSEAFCIHHRDSSRSSALYLAGYE